ncbi:putative urease accessory protein ureD-like [Colletotrichum spaethianum]|uniref:Urease accessory protein ureD-like n=1 Tax=Colletotrichum spaethianum TaxID=700344 RepID=A0AA37PGV3_9PEZI|nr:putative urease accessory protein ureD-like [Colletotrichum spaethianum]GKT52076.1 putative urease accessory protein ureD-like [Colletotrichum spaethianum]
MKSKTLRSIKKVLVANRGEIAVRCIKACRELGVHSVAVYTDADTTSLHALLADEAIALRGNDTYTDGDAILDICRSTGADAVFPGYGFLSENVDFADAVTAAGIIFVGPSSASIKAMGLKHEARSIAEAVNVPVIPGTSLIASAHEAIEGAKKLGFPVMLKATGGGGGMGLQICHDDDDVPKAFATVESRAGALFKNSGVFLERYYPRSRHVEVQVFGNGATVVAFGERECSLQRRHQKVIEECPSPFVDQNPGLREKMLQAAVDYASQLQYKSAGTVEFLVDDETADFFFLEMNTRLQVEHGITEMCYGVDLVHLMLYQADHERGGQLGMPSDELQSFQRPRPHGSAIEARVYAEVPLLDFAPSPGLLQHVSWPQGDGVRVDTWVKSGQQITPLYDPLLAKVMVHSPDGRAGAQKKMLAALASTALQGTQTNLQYLSQVLRSDAFTNGSTLTNFLATFRVEVCAVQVLSPGVFTTVQDYPGRTTVGHGVPPSGPMDDLSSRAANIIVGNDPKVELLEITMTGPELMFHDSAVVAVCGAQVPVAVDDEQRPMWSRIIVKQGQTLKIGNVFGEGLRTYLAVKGGFPEIPLYLGSKSTAPELVLGGLQGRKLQTNDILALSPESGSWAATATAFSLPPGAIPDYGVSEIYCLNGPYGSEDILTPEGMETITNSTWTVSHNSSRSGVRLEGSRLKWARTTGGGGGSHPSNVFDYGYPNGGVNWTGEYPVIFPRDRPDLGGFACPVTICSAEMWKVGQLKPGDALHLRLVTFENALEITRRNEEYLESVAALVDGKATKVAFPGTRFGPRKTTSILQTTQSHGDHPHATYRQGGDTSIIVEYGQQIADLRNTVCVWVLKEKLMARGLVGVRGEPNLATLTVHYDPLEMHQSELLQTLMELDESIEEVVGIKVAVRELSLPLCVDHPTVKEATERYMESIRPTAAYLPDNVDYLRKNNALETRRQVFDSLVKTPWLTVAVGFFVGTPILFPLDPKYVFTGQKYNPNRAYTPSGSIGLGGSLLAIYPVAAPGGYQLMGRTLGLWDMLGTRPGFSPSRPWLFNYFDIVRFREVSKEEFDQAERDFEAGRYVFEITDEVLAMDEYIAKFDEAARDPAHQEWRQRQIAAAREMGELEQRLFGEWTEAKAAEMASQSEGGGDGTASAGAVTVESPMNANVWKVLVKVGDVLENKQTVAILEAMKMEIKVLVSDAQAGAVVTKITRPPAVLSAREHPSSWARKQHS